MRFLYHPTRAPPTLHRAGCAGRGRQNGDSIDGLIGRNSLKEHHPPLCQRSEAEDLWQIYVRFVSKRPHHLLSLEHGSPRFPRNFATPSQKKHPSNPCKSVFKKIIRVQISLCSSSNPLHSILHLPPQHRAKQHLNILKNE